MSDKIASTFDGVEITYVRYGNLWQFIVGGKEYNEPSLALAESKIEEVMKAIASKRRKNFEPIPAYTSNGVHGRITSIAEGQSWRGSNSKSVWFVTDKGDRSKEDIKDLYIDSPENKERFLKIRTLRAEAESTHKSLAKMSDANLPDLDAKENS